MARLVDRLAIATRSNLPDPEQVEMMSQSWGLSQTERILQTYRSYSVFGYASNSIVYACALARIQLLAQAQFKFQDLRTGKLYGNADLAILEEPWKNGTTSDLIANMEQHDYIAGNAFIRRAPGAIVVMRPDWVDILSVEIVEGADDDGNVRAHSEVLGYLYSEGGYGVGTPVFYDVEDVVHWSPMPDPMSKWRGMSPMTPVLREINADVSMTQHRQVFFDQAGTPNLILKYAGKLQPTTVESIRDRWRARFGGPQGAGSAVILDEGFDGVTVVGSTFESMRFTDLQNAGEVRIAAASGVPALVAGMIAGLDSAAYGTAYAAAYRAMANTTGAFLWGSLCAALAKFVNVPEGSRLWYDTTSIPALRDDEKDRHEATQIAAAAISTLLTAGYESDSIIAAVVSGDLTQLKHTGLVSVQLYKAAAKDDSSLPISKIPIDKAPAFSPPTLPSA